jgi:hypothetical protein
MTGHATIRGSGRPMSGSRWRLCSTWGRCWCGTGTAAPTGVTLVELTAGLYHALHGPTRLPGASALLTLWAAQQAAGPTRLHRALRFRRPYLTASTHLGICDTQITAREPKRGRAGQSRGLFDGLTDMAANKYCSHHEGGHQELPYRCRRTESR